MTLLQKSKFKVNLLILLFTSFEDKLTILLSFIDVLQERSKCKVFICYGKYKKDNIFSGNFMLHKI